MAYNLLRAHFIIWFILYFNWIICSSQCSLFGISFLLIFVLFYLFFSFFYCYACSSLVVLAIFYHTNTHKNNQSNRKYDLTLVASDSLNESFTSVVVYIKDSNDLPPVFNQTIYAAHILEELADPLPYRLVQVA